MKEQSPLDFKTWCIVVYYQKPIQSTYVHIINLVQKKQRYSKSGGEVKN